MIFEKIETNKEIYNVLLECALDVFDQKLNTSEILQNLSVKYANSAVFIALKDDTDLIGYAAYYKNNLKTKKAFLSMIVINSKYQGQGYGQQLIDYLFLDCKNSGMKTLSLEVNKYNNKALKFYRKNNFVKESESKNSIWLVVSL